MITLSTTTGLQKMKKVNETNRPTLFKIVVVQLFMEIVDEI